MASRVPPELFRNILSEIADSDQLKPCEDPTVRRAKMKHLSACASTCVYWAQSTRTLMYERLVLRSNADLRDLQSFLQSSSSLTRIKPIGQVLWQVVVFYNLGDYPWFCNIGGLQALGAHKLLSVNIHVSGPVPPLLAATGTRRPVLHPLFFAAPRIPPTSFRKLHVFLDVENAHFTNMTVLFNLLQDCLLLQPIRLSCNNLSWDTSTRVTPFSVGFKLTHRSTLITAMGCTDNILVSAMLFGVPHHEFSLRRQGPHLSLADSSNLFEVMHTSLGRTQSSNDLRMDFIIASSLGFENVQKNTPATLPTGSDIYLNWRLRDLSFSCIATQRPWDIGDIRFVSYIVIDVHHAVSLTAFKDTLQTTDWGTLLDIVQRFPDLRGIVIQSWSHIGDSRRFLTEIVVHLRELWSGLDSLLELYDYRRHGGWTRIELGVVLAEINEMVHTSIIPDTTAC